MDDRDDASCVAFATPELGVADLLKRIGVLVPSEMELLGEAHGLAGDGDAAPEEGLT